jgi:hypothetical protein
MNELFQDPTVGRIDDDPSEITTIENFENEMTGLSEAGVKCSAALCLSSAKLRSTDSVNPRAVLSRVRPRYRHLL